jgi:PAS domain S-box-containing protein
MPHDRTVLVIASVEETDRYYRPQLQQDQEWAYTVLALSPQALRWPPLPAASLDAILLAPPPDSPSCLELIDQLIGQMAQGGDRCPPLVVIDRDNTELAVQALQRGACDYLVRDRTSPAALRQALARAITLAPPPRPLPHPPVSALAALEALADGFGLLTAQRDSTGQIVAFAVDYLNRSGALSLADQLPPLPGTPLFEALGRLVTSDQPLTHTVEIYADPPDSRRLVRALELRATCLDQATGETSKPWVAHPGPQAEDRIVATWRDITGHRQRQLDLQHAVVTLQQQRCKLQRLIDNAPVGIIIGSATGLVTTMNDAMLRLYGYNRQELDQSLNWRNHVPPERASQAQASVQHLRQWGVLPPHETERLRADGTRIPLLLSGIRWIDDSDEYVIFAVDLTAQKQAEAAIQQLNHNLTNRVAELQSLLELIPVGIAIATDPSCRRMQYNAYLRQLLGVVREQNISKSARSAQPPPYQVLRAGQEITVDDLPMQRAARLGLEVRDVEFEVVGGDGTVRQVLAHATPLHDPQGQVRGCVGAFLDITDRNRAAAALRESEERYRTLFESIDEGFCVIEVLFDAAGTPVDYRFIETNPAFVKQTGLTNATGQCILDLAPNLDQYWFETYGQVVTSGIPSRFEGYTTDLNRWFDVYAFPMGSPGGARVAVLFSDITQRKQAEQEREHLLNDEKRARAEAERANRIKDEFLAVLSHELRSPLNPILGWTKLLQTGHLDEAKTAAALATIERNVQVQTQLIDDLLDVAKILRGKLSLHEGPVDLAVVIEAALETVKTAATAKSITLYPNLAPTGPVLGDAARLQQIVWNLLSNAIKFTPAGGEVKITLGEGDHQAEITVTDTGRGISPDFLPHIFESFRQEDASITRHHGGLGLGLAIVAQLVEAHGGTITATSEGEGRGTTFYVALPLLPLAPPPLSPQPPRAESLDLQGLRVLAVDDEPDARDLLATLLHQYGAEAVTVASAPEALAQIATFCPDVLVSDIGMPGIDGYTLIEKIRALPATAGGAIPALALTAYAREDDRQRAIASGFQQHIPKPLNPKQLAQALWTLTRQP